jgi:CheY-like chemotaxis protein
VECDFLPDEVEVGAKEIGTLRKMIGVLRRQNDELISKVSEQKNQIAILGSVKMFSRDAESDIGQLRQQVKELTLDRDTLLTENRALIGELHELRTAAGLGAEVQVARIAAGGGSGFANARFSPPLTDTAIRPAPLAVLPAPKLDSPFQEIADLTGKLRATASSLSLRPADKGAFDEFVSLLKDTYRIAAILGPHPVATIVSGLDTLLDGAARQTAIQALVFLSRLLTHDMLPRAGKLPPATVIAVDDDPALLAVITASLEITNLRAIGCADARTALDTLQDNHCDVIFLDIGLPDMNGLDMCAAIRGLHKHDRTPIVFLTGDDTAQNRERSTLKGASDFIGKPFTMAEFTLKAHIWALKNRLDVA